MKQTHSISYHDTPSPEMGEDTTKEVIKTIVTKVEPAIVLDKIWREMAKYITLQKLRQTIQKGDWEARRKTLTLQIS